MQIRFYEPPADFSVFVLVRLSFGFQPNLVTKTQKKIGLKKPDFLWKCDLMDLSSSGIKNRPSKQESHARLFKFSCLCENLKNAEEN